mmetsp:Transcript_4330/g.4789  ORF Transcript_4330/g.4789 Transcript_4330/m.4789 type:complete len:140 (+) Transcript_4330:57-476(+)
MKTTIHEATVVIDEELAKYESFDVEMYEQRFKNTAPRNDRSVRAPVASSWLRWRVRLPDTLATITILFLVMYEIIAIVSLFVSSLRTVMVNDGLMYTLCALNVVLCATLAVVVFVTQRDLNSGVLTRTLGRSKVDVQDD